MNFIGKKSEMNINSSM